MIVNLLSNIIATIRDCFEYDNHKYLKLAIYNANYILDITITLQYRLL